MTAKTSDISEKIEIKICGLSTREAVDASIAAGADYVGLVHFAKSPRHLDLGEAADLRAYAAGRVKTVLLLANAQPDETGRALEIVKPDIVQFHGSEPAQWLQLVKEYSNVEIWKALGVKDAPTLEKSRRFVGVADRLLFDAPAKKLPGGQLPGGTGTSFDWSLLAYFDHRLPWGLAGGLSPENVAGAIRATGAKMVDVSSGVESEAGIKDMDRIAAFCQAVREAK